jgi:hypothetical protein
VEIARQILDLDRLHEVRGYGVLPGIGESVDPVGAMPMQDRERAMSRVIQLAGVARVVSRTA